MRDIARKIAARILLRQACEQTDNRSNTDEVAGLVGKSVTKPKSSLGLRISGSDGNQQVALDDENTLKVIFGTDLPPLAEGLLSHCIKVLKGNEASDD